MRNFPTHFWTRFTSDELKDQIAFLATDEEASSTTYWAWTRRIQRIAVGLLDAGFESGERLAIVAPNSQAWLDLAYAAWMVGGVLVPLPSNWDRRSTLRCLARAQVGWVAVADEKARLELRGQADKFPPLQWITLAGDDSSIDDVTTVSALDVQGRYRAKRGDLKELAKATYTLEPDAPAIILYPFDQTQDPHGAVFGGGKLAVMLAYLVEGFQFDDDRVAVLLSYGWFAGLLSALAANFGGQPLLVANSLSALRDDLTTLSPTVLVCGPAFVEGLADSFKKRLEEAPDVLKRVEEGESLGWGTTLQKISGRAARKLLYDPLKSDLGGALTRIYLVDGKVPDDVFDVLERADIKVLGMWGVPEAGISHIERPEATRRNSVGRPLQGYACKIPGKADAQGLVHVRSDVLFDGYWDQKGPRYLDDTGFLDTGIKGRIESGFLML